MTLNPLNRREIRGRIGVFFQSHSWKHTLVFFSFIALASSFWALQYIRQRFDFEVPMKIHYLHIPAGIALFDSLPQEITLHVQDKGSVYLNYLIKKKKRSLYIAIDLQPVSPGRDSYTVDQADLYNLITDQLFTTTQLKSFTPDKIEINYSQPVPNLIEQKSE